MQYKARRYSPYPDRDRRGDSHKQDQREVDGINGRCPGMPYKTRVRKRRF